MSQMKTCVVMAGLLTLSAIGLGGCDKGVTDKDVTDNQISLVDVQKLWAKRSDDKSLLLINAEMPAVYQAGHIPGSVNMPWTDFSENQKSGDVDPRITAYDNVIVYGQNRAPGAVQAATKRMLYSGYDVQAFLGGLEEWRAAGLPVDKGPGKKWSEEPRGQLK